MLPSTGYFKGILCPFNDNGLCERPYCHYRHLDYDESGAILQKLVSAAVLKALQQNDTSGAKTSAQLSQGDTAANPTTSTVTAFAAKATYNPTPIAELNKINSTDTENLEDPNEQRRRHIPVPYTPRKPAGLPIKRSVDTNDPKPFIYNPPGPPIIYRPGSAENVQNDKYTPTGTVESKDQYVPGTEKELQEYTPDSTVQDSPSKLNYVPSTDKSVNKKKILEYRPAKVAAKIEKPSATYQPTPRALAPCFSSDEEEPVTKKRKLSSDLNSFDDLGPEFDILGQILDEETPNEKDKSNDKDKNEKSKHSSKDNKKNNSDIKNDKCNKSHHKSKSDKEKSDENHKTKSDKEKSKEKHKSKSEKKSSEENHKKKLDKKSSDENLRKKTTDENHKSRSEKKSSDESYKSKSEKKSSEENHRSKSEKKLSDENHKSKSDKKSSDENYKSMSDKNSSDEKYKNKSDKKEKVDVNDDRKENKKSSHKSSRRDSEKEKKDSKEKHSNDSKRHSSRSSDRSPKQSKQSSKTSQKKSDSKSSKATEKNFKEKRHTKSKDKKRHRSEDKVLDSSDHETLDTEENGLDAEDYESSDPDEDAIALECKRIFEEYVPTEKPKSPDENLLTNNLTEEEYIPSKKRVSRTVDKNIKVVPKAPVKPDFKVSAANTMAERLSKVREYHSSRNIQSSTITNSSVHNEIRDHSRIELQKPTFSAPNPIPTKIRIAHVPYASTMLNTKKTITPSPPPGKIPASSSTTISQTIKKGVQRVAHMPSDKFIDRPGVLEPLASKIPANIRSTYLNMMIDECLKLYLSTHDAYARAQHEELTTSKKCCTVPIYKNSAVLAVSRLRKELVESNGVKKSSNDCSTLKSDSSLKSINSGSWSIESKNKKDYDSTHHFSGAKFYENIQKWILSEEQLRENSFPRSHETGQKGRAIIYGQNKQNPPKGYLRTCCRCKKEYMVNKRGFAVVKEECIYHPNRKYRVRGEARYQCCSQDGTADGCCVAPSHVYEYVDFENLKGYVKTMPSEHHTDDYGVYSLDCEMCYTTNGLDLTRVTVINSTCKVVYETLIKPLHPIIDYNTRYSGITEEQMCNVKTTLLEVQATLLAMFNSKTILVGHSLESDFKALKLIHDTVIDTSVLFPHKMGPPFKRALRNLSSEYLKKIIQNSVDGHDSAEDAMVCMELLHYKLKEDLKTR